MPLIHKHTEHTADAHVCERTVEVIPMGKKCVGLDLAGSLAAWSVTLDGFLHFWKLFVGRAEVTERASMEYVKINMSRTFSLQDEAFGICGFLIGYSAII